VTESEALDQAWIYLTALADGDPATASYKLTNWGNALSQDIIEAKIPEPTSMALGALGLAGLSLVRRRKS
jgi:MYXO-CTERM domain-containing protein